MNLQELTSHWACDLLRADLPLTIEIAPFTYHRFLNILRENCYRKLCPETPEEFAQNLAASPLGN